MSKTARIQCIMFSSFLAGAIIFIIIAFGSEMLATKASDTFKARLNTGEVVDVAIFTREPYTDKVWVDIRKVSIYEIAQQSDFTKTEIPVTNKLEQMDVSLIAIRITPEIYIIKLK